MIFIKKIYTLFSFFCMYNFKVNQDQVGNQIHNMYHDKQASVQFYGLPIILSLS